jgi:soluble lytic murein transglycosylase-like protein
MAIQQLDLGAVYNTLAQQRGLALREREAEQQGALNALQMARYQRESDEQARVQSELAKLNDPNLDEAGQISALARAYPELRAKQLFREGDYKIGPDGTIINGHTGEVVSRPPMLDSEATSATVPPPRTQVASAGSMPPPAPTQREGSPPPRPSANVPAVYQQTIDTHAERTGLSGGLIGRVFMAESGGRPDVVNGQTTSSAGAVGPMQTMPATLKNPGYGVQPARDGSVDEQFRVGTDYLAAMMKKYNGNQILALGAYNWGPGNVDNWLADGADMSKVPAETKAYIKKILGDDLGLPKQQTAEAPQQAPTQQPSGDEGFSRVRNPKGLGLTDPPTGMQWIARQRPDGSYETKVAPIPGMPDDRADKRAAENFDQETKLRTEHQNLVKGFDVAQTNYATMPELAADETGGSDIALVNAFFKTFAPDSTVMEGEFAAAAKAGGVPDRIVGLIDKALTGQMLTPQQRQELTTAAGRFYNQRKTSVEGANEKYTKLAQSYPGINADRVVINPIRELPKYEPKPKEEKKTEVAATPPDINGRVAGQTYQTPRGPAIWRGNGWELTK